MGRLVPAVAMVAMTVAIILCSNSCRASILIRKAKASANATYEWGGDDEVEVEVAVMLESHVARFLEFEGNEPITDQTAKQNVQSCGNGAGNPNGACGGNPNNPKNCPKYENTAKC